MKIQLGAAFAAGLVCAAGFAQAAEVTGAELSFGYSAFTEDTDFRALRLEGAVEVGITRQFAVQLDLGLHDFGLSDETGTNVALHGIYHVNDDTSLGLFYGRDMIDGEGANYYGLEAGHELSGFDVEGYVGHGEEAGVGATVVGVSGSYNLNDAFSMGLSLDNANFDGDVSVRRIGVKGEYDFSDSASVYAEVGSLRGSALGLSGSETFVGVGASFAVGADRGATFGKRGLLHLLPGL